MNDLVSRFSMLGGSERIALGLGSGVILKSMVSSLFGTWSIYIVFAALVGVASHNYGMPARSPLLQNETKETETNVLFDKNAIHISNCIPKVPMHFVKYRVHSDNDSIEEQIERFGDDAIDSPEDRALLIEEVRERIRGNRRLRQQRRVQIREENQRTKPDYYTENLSCIPNCKPSIEVNQLKEISLNKFLNEAQLLQYEKHLNSLGAEIVPHLKDINEQDLEELGFKILERRRFFKSLEKINL